MIDALNLVSFNDMYDCKILVDVVSSTNDDDCVDHLGSQLNIITESLMRYPSKRKTLKEDINTLFNRNILCILFENNLIDKEEINDYGVSCENELYTISYFSTDEQDSFYVGWSHYDLPNLAEIDIELLSDNIKISCKELTKMVYNKIRDREFQKKYILTKGE